MFRSSGRKIELRFSAEDLVNKDIFSLSDPFLVCHTVRDGQPHTEVGRTETVQDDLNPVWATTFTFTYDAAVHQHTILVVDLFDRDSLHETALTKHDFLGRAAFQLSDLLKSDTLHLRLPLRPARTLIQTTSTSSTSSVTDGDDDISGSGGNGGRQRHYGFGYQNNNNDGSTMSSFASDRDQQQPNSYHGAAAGGVVSSKSSLNLLKKRTGPASLGNHPWYTGNHHQAVSTGQQQQPPKHDDDDHHNNTNNEDDDTTGSNSMRRYTTKQQLYFPQPPQQPKPGLPRSTSSTRLLPTPRKGRSRTSGGSTFGNGDGEALSKSTSVSGELIRATSGSRADKVSGHVNIYAEDIRTVTTDVLSTSTYTPQPTQPGRILLRVRSANLKSANGVRGFRGVTQFYELQRERNFGDGNTWSCVFRSGDGNVIDRNNYVVFDDVVISEQAVNNLQGDRKLRLAFYRRHSKRPHSLISYVTTSLAGMKKGTKRDGQTLSLKMEGVYEDDDGLGCVLVSRVRFGRGGGGQDEENNLTGNRTTGNHTEDEDDNEHNHNGDDDDDGVTDVDVDVGPDDQRQLQQQTHDDDDDDDSVRRRRQQQHVLQQRPERTVSVQATDGDVKPDSVDKSRNVALQLRADHFLNKKYISSLNDSPMKHQRRLLHRPSFISLH